MYVSRLYQMLKEKKKQQQQQQQNKTKTKTNKTKTKTNKKTPRKPSFSTVLSRQKLTNFSSGYVTVVKNIQLRDPPS